MKKKLGLMLLGALVVSQVTAFAYTNVQDGTKYANYGTVFAGGAVNISMTNYTLTNMNARGTARLYVPGIGNIDKTATSSYKKASAQYTYVGFQTEGAHNHYYTESLVQR